MKTTDILGVKVNTGLTMQEIVSRISDLLHDKHCHYICTTNAEFIMGAQGDPEFLQIINNSDLSIVDGSGVAYADVYLNETKNLNNGVLKPFMAFYKGLVVGLRGLIDKDYIKKVSGVALCEELCSFASMHGLNVFLLGGWPKDFFGRNIKTDTDLAELAASNLKNKYPGLNVIGATSQFKHLPVDDVRTLTYIKEKMREGNTDHIDMLFVAYNHPNQEKWIQRNSQKIPAYVSMGVGGTFDYLAGVYKRAPMAFINMNLEWLYKLFTQPRRIKRILRAFPIFPIKVYIRSIK